MKYLKVFTDFLELLEPLSMEERGVLFTEMLRYVETGVAPDIQTEARFVFPRAKQIIDLERSFNEKQHENGSKGGRPKTNENPTKPKETHTNPTKASKEKEKEKENTTNPIGLDSKRFTPPTLEEVKAYCQERKNGVDPEHFIDYYASQGWKKANGQPLKDWKAGVRQWEQKDKQEAVKKNHGSENYSQKVVRMDELDNLIGG